MSTTPCFLRVAAEDAASRHVRAVTQANSPSLCSMNLITIHLFYSVYPKREQAEKERTCELGPRAQPAHLPRQVLHAHRVVVFRRRGPGLQPETPMFSSSLNRPALELRFLVMSPLLCGLHSQAVLWPLAPSSLGSREERGLSLCGTSFTKPAPPPASARMRHRRPPASLFFSVVFKVPVGCFL